MIIQTYQLFQRSTLRAAPLLLITLLIGLTTVCLGQSIESREKVLGPRDSQSRATALFAQTRRAGGTSATQFRTLENIIDDQMKGKTPQDKKITIPAEGGRLVINNVFRNAKFSSDDRYVGYKISDEIEYSAGGGGEHFIITVHGDQKTLAAGELRFISLLGITKTAACRLRGDVGGVLEYLVPPGEDSRHVRSGFSWCRQR